MTIDPQDPTLQQASELLAQMEKAEAETTDATPATEADKGSATTEQRAAQGNDGQVHSTATTSNEPGAPATEAPTKPAEQGKPAEEQGSKFARNQARLQGGWNKLNEEKTALQKERETLEATRQEFAAKQKEFYTRQQKASQPKYKPEDYESSAKEWQAQAEQLEGEGKYDEADEKRVLARKAMAHAKDLRANPPKPAPTDAQAEAEFQKAQKEWWSKAAIDFPDSAKAGTPLHTAIKATITPPGQPGHDASKFDAVVARSVVEEPKTLYYLARLKEAELRADKAVTFEKEAVELRAKVKELEGKLAIPGEQIATQLGRAKPDSEKTDEELEAELQRDAATMDRRF